jgi:hypothetical protein
MIILETDCSDHVMYFPKVGCQEALHREKIVKVLLSEELRIY